MAAGNELEDALLNMTTNKIKLSQGATAVPTDTDNIMGALLQQKLQERQQLKNAPAERATPAPTGFTAPQGGSAGAQLLMNSMAGFGNNLFGNENRAAEAALAQTASEDKLYNRQLAADKVAWQMGQDILAGDRANESNKLAQAKVNKIEEADQINLANQRNTAKQQLLLQGELGELYQKKKDLGEFLNKGNAAGYLEVGTGGNDYTLTAAGKKDTAFAEKFGNRVNMADEMQVLQDKYQQAQTTAATDTNRLNDFAALNVAGQAGAQFTPTDKANRAYQDKIASLDFEAKKKVEAILGEGSLKNNAFTESLFNLEGTVVEAGKSALDSLRNESPEVSNEVNSMKNYAIGENKQFKAMPSLEQDYVLATFLKENGGVSESWLDLYNGKWSEDVVDQNFGKYVTAFTDAKIGVTDAKAIQTKNARAKLGEQINFENSAGR